MAKGIPSKKAEIGPLKAKRLENVPIVSIGAFRMIAEKEDKETGDKYEVDQVNLSIDIDSGFIQRKEHPDGEPVLDDNGNEKTHYINIGYMTLSGHQKSNFVPFIRAASFDGPEFINDKGGLNDEAQQSIEVEFGTNGLGNNYEGKDWDDLPYYTLPSLGGKEDKRDVEVPITSFKIMGYELIGRRIDMALEVTSKGYNKPTAFIEPRDPIPLGQVAAKPAARGIPAAQEVEDPFEDEKPPFKPNGVVVPNVEEHGKGPVYIWEIMEVANVPVDHRLPLVRYILSEPSVKSVAEMNVEQCRSLRDLYKGDNAILVNAYSDLYPESADGADEF